MKNIIVFTMLLGFSLAGFAQKADSIKTPKIRLRGTPIAGNEPLMVIDGNKQSRGTISLNEINQNDIEAITVLKDSLAIAKYGADGFAGVIEIETKTKSVGTSLLKAKPIKPVDLHLNGKVSGLTIRPLPDGQMPVKIRDLLNRDFDPKAKPLYVVDGKEVSDINSLNQASIQSIEVLKDSSATTLHGDKGKNGVVIITTKKATAKKN
jgi:TonB-dependent SusC/RagA subfamily outer membrane receptor